MIMDIHQNRYINCEYERRAMSPSIRIHLITTCHDMDLSGLKMRDMGNFPNKENRLWISDDGDVQTIIDLLRALEAEGE